MTITRNIRKMFAAITLLLLCSSANAQVEDAKYAHLLNMCVACHGIDGESKFTSIPNLKWQNSQYIVAQLQAFKSGQRNDITMSKVAKLLSEQDMQKMANYFNQGKGH
ncbi:cytochrome c [Shewanella sp. NIFS-20-20]|uniref:c-type cytochrome n=1 Tax=Shewanella sp. NIFS-20-20 TaxID=2853806 RepID=UPI001C446CB8|nr:cytochrome c [Shewanella sp. NIFS-20-20]MBV7315086.1 cytochrome c [Shewanella sp. NIFS-20-20]